MTTLKPLDIELVKPDNHSDPLPPQSQDVLVDVLFGDDKQKVSHTHDTQTTQTPDNQTDVKDNGEVDNKTFTTVSQASDEVLTTTSVHKNKRKAGRPRGSKNKNKKNKDVIKLVPSSVEVITRLNKDSKFYVHTYSQSLSVEEIVALHSTPVRRTASEQFALNLLVGVAKNDPKSVDRYWQIVGKGAKSPEIAPKTRTNTSLLDDILTSVEGEIFGENVDATTPTTPDIGEKSPKTLDAGKPM